MDSTALVTKTAATAANESDAKGLKHVSPKQGAVVADKGYCTKTAQKTIKANGCHDMTIKIITLAFRRGSGNNHKVKQMVIFIARNGHLWPGENNCFFGNRVTLPLWASGEALVNDSQI